MPPVFHGTQANTLAELAFQLGLDAERFTHTVTEYNNACQPVSSTIPFWITAPLKICYPRKRIGRDRWINLLTTATPFGGESPSLILG